MVRLENRPANGKADSESVLFRCEKRLKYAACITTGKSAALILHRHTDFPVLDAGGDIHHSILRSILFHRITAIDDDIQKDLLQLYLVARSVGQHVGERGSN